MHLTKKHFDLLADALRDARRRADPVVLEGVDVAAESVATKLATTNDSFSRDRFLEACEHGQSNQEDRTNS